MPVSMNNNRTKTQQTGSVILEALIAILIFSIGILALVGMQATAIGNVADAKYRSTAVFLADQIIGTMWATALPVLDPITNQPLSGVIASTPDPGFCTASGVGCGGGSANAIALTTAWMASGVQANLPQGTASIAITNFPPATPVASMVTVTITWKPPKELATAPAHRHFVSTIIN